MNARKAKKLRKLALAVTIGEPMVAYSKRRFDAAHKEIPRTLLSTCTRYHYKQLKA